MSEYKTHNSFGALVVTHDNEVYAVDLYEDEETARKAMLARLQGVWSNDATANYWLKDNAAGWWNKEMQMNVRLTVTHTWTRSDRF